MRRRLNILLYIFFGVLNFIVSVFFSLIFYLLLIFSIKIDTNKLIKSLEHTQKKFEYEI